MSAIHAWATQRDSLSMSAGSQASTQFGAQP